MTQILCPFCAADYLIRARLIPLNQEVLLCPECDALWSLGVEITKENNVDFGEHMAKFGLTANWKYVEKILDE